MPSGSMRKNGPTARRSDTTPAPCARPVGLGRGELLRRTGADAAQRLRHGAEGAQVGARADHDGGAAGAQSADRLREVRRRHGDRHPVRHVVAADDDDGDIRTVVRRERVDLAGEVGRFRTDDRPRPQPHGPVELPCEALREASPEGLLAVLRPEARRDRVAEQQQLERRAPESGPPDPVGGRGGVTERLADPPPRDRRLPRERDPGAEDDGADDPESGGSGDGERSPS